MFIGKYPGKKIDNHGVHVGPGVWLDLIHEANGVLPGLFGAPKETGEWWAGGGYEEYEQARIIHNPDGSVSIVALSEEASQALAQAEVYLREDKGIELPPYDPTDDIRTYEPKSTYVNGVPRAHPVFRREFVAEVHRLLHQADIDPADANKEVDGGIAAAYEDWYQDPSGFVQLVKLAREVGADDPLPEQPAPVEKLWRLNRPKRRDAARVFVGRHVQVERWLGRVAANGDVKYTGTVVAVAVSTIGTGDLLILTSDEVGPNNGTTWAISLVQVAFMAVSA